MLASLLPVLTACANGTVGIVAGDVMAADGARVIVVSGYGLSLRGLPADRGMTVGFSRRAYIYPDGASDPPDPGHYAGWVPLPASPPVAWRTQSLGLDVKASSVGLGVSLGYLEETVMAYLPDSADLVYRLHFIADDPAATVLTLCQGGQACGEARP